MKKIMFTVGLSQDISPKGWRHVSKAYLDLSISLRKLGHECILVVNKNAIDRHLKKVDYFYIEDKNIKDLIKKFTPDICFIWGGRRPGDIKTKNMVLDLVPNCKFIYSEAGWFPQKGTIYFDSLGTNANASFSQKSYVEKATPNELEKFLSLRKRIIRKDLGLPIWKSISKFKITRANLQKKILVPLQDEKDSNITNSSPFKTMRELVTFLATTYPNQNFIVRSHPRAKSENLPLFKNVEYQESNIPLFKQFSEIGMVIGINSTVLLQSAMHNKTVVALGDGLGTPGQCVYKMDVNNPIAKLDDIVINSEAALNRLAVLLVKKQLQRNKLSQPRYIKKSYLWDMIQ